MDRLEWFRKGTIPRATTGIIIHTADKNDHHLKKKRKVSQYWTEKAEKVSLRKWIRENAVITANTHSHASM